MESASITDKKYTIGEKELVFLAAYLGHNTLVGVRDPFLGYLAEQVEKEWTSSKRKLIDDEMIFIENGGEISVKPEIAEALRICCMPKTFVILNIFKKNTQTSLTVNSADVKSVVVEDVGERIHLTVYADGQYDMRAIICEALSLSSNAKAGNRAYELPAEQAAVLLSGGKNIPEQVKDLEMVSALRKPDIKALLTLGNMRDIGFRSIGVYVKDVGIFSVEETPRNTISITSVCADDIVKEVLTHMKTGEGE